MNKKMMSTYDTFFASLNARQKKDFEREYKELLLSELLIALMTHDDVSVRKLAEAAGLSATIVQGMRAGTRKNVSALSLFKIFNALGYKLVAEKNGTRFPIDMLQLSKK